MPGISKTDRVIKQLKQPTNNSGSVPLIDGFVLPNNSGDHAKSIKRDDPINDYDLVNKKYVDDTFATIVVESLAGFDTDDLSQGSTNLYSQWLNNGSEIYFMDKVGIGTTNPTVPLDVVGSGGIVCKGTSSGDTEIQLSAGLSGYRTGGSIISSFTSYSDSSANPSIFNFQACRGSQSSPSASSNGDRVGRLSYAGRHSGGSFISTALIEARVDAAVSSTEVPLSINFITGTTAGNRTERLRITSAGYCGFATTSPTQIIDINDNSIRLRTAKTPSSASDTGTTGQICWDSNYIYVCVATNTWKRTAISTW